MLAPKPYKEPPPIKATVKITSIYDDENHRNYCNHRCDTAYVKDALEAELDYWRYWSPVLIDAGTGKGKSSLVFEILIRNAKQLGRNVVILSNRSALNLEQKRKVIQHAAPELEDQLTDKGIRDRDIFGNTAVVLYQALPRFVKDPENEAWLKNVLYCVADECHYFTADAGFNRNCGYHLKLILDHFKQVIRIYMTATSWSVLHVLYEAEMGIRYMGGRYMGHFNERFFHRYYWEQDFGHVDLRFVGDLSEIEQIIRKNHNEKFLVFVDSKEKGRSFAHTLGKQATYLDADSKNTREMAKLVKDNCFETQVLVTTKVLDCGVNIWDEKLRNVVIVTDDRTSMIQMLGRKRCKPGERINLWVCDVDKKTLAMRYRDGQELLAVLERYETSGKEGLRRMRNEIWNGDDDRLRLYFKPSEEDIFPNRVAFYALKRKQYFYEKILNGQRAFREAVCGWLGKTVEPEVVPQDELQAFCEAYLGQELTEEEIVTVRELIVKAAGATGFVEPQPTRVATLGREALNNRMGKFNCPYQFEKNAWKIIEKE